MKCRCNLNQALKKHFVRVRRLEPYFFPMLVGVVEMRGIKRFKSFLIQPIFFVRFHPCFQGFHPAVTDEYGIIAEAQECRPQGAQHALFLIVAIGHLNFSIYDYPRYHG